MLAALTPKPRDAPTTTYDGIISYGNYYTDDSEYHHCQLEYLGPSYDVGVATKRNVFPIYHSEFEFDYRNFDG